MASPARVFTCPVCHGSMRVVQSGQRQARQCMKGDGLWVEPAQLHAFFSDAGQAELARQARGGPPGSKFCPICSRSMAGFRFRGVELDACTQGDGYWFDKGELGTLTFQAAPPTARGGKPPVPTRPAPRDPAGKES